MAAAFQKVLQSLEAAREFPAAARIEMLEPHIRERIVAFEQSQTLGTQEFLRQIMDMSGLIIRARAAREQLTYVDICEMLMMML